MLKNAKSVEPMIEALRSSADEGARGSIVKALGQLRDKRAVPSLISIIETDDGSVACFSAKALGEIGDEQALEPLIKVLEHPWGRGWARSWAAEAVGKLDDLRALQPLIKALVDKEVAVRIAAAKGLMYLGDAGALPALDRAKLEDEGIDIDTGETVKWAATRARRYIRHIKQHKK